MLTRVLVSILSLAAITPLWAQAADASVDILITALELVRVDSHLRGPVAIDPRTRSATRTTHGALYVGEHAPEVLNALKLRTGAKMIAYEDALTCSRPDGRLVCELTGASAVISFGIPQIRGDTAEVQVLLHARHPNSATGRGQLTREGTVIAVRRGTRWVAESFRVSHQS